ncbi:RDD family protein [Rubritalea spongiae]|uniref:RDD family protein n=1 Tax=Rubritalea spongiae TaxID=430797 RepID=A0ABW5E260_9BACT
MAKPEQKIDTLQSVELGDGVEILLRVAGPFARAMALVIDYLIILGLLFVIGIVTTMLAIGSNGNIAAGVMLISLFLMSWGYFAFFEGGKKAATPGKRALGIRVVDGSGNRANRGQVLVRNILRYIDMLPGVPSGSMGIFIGGYGAGLMTCFLSKKFQRLGDLVANTVVVYDKPVQHLSATLPPALEAVAPPIALTREEQAAIAAFRERAGLWSEARRIELANHASAVTGESDRKGMTKLLGMADWLTEGR